MNVNVSSNKGNFCSMIKHAFTYIYELGAKRALTHLKRVIHIREANDSVTLSLGEK